MDYITLRMQAWLWTTGVLVVIVLYLWHRDRRTRAHFAGLAHFPQLPVIGNAHQIYGDSRVLFRLISHMANVSDDTDGRFVIWIGPFPIFVTQNPEDVKTITNAFIEKPYFYNFGRMWLGDGLVTAPGIIWKANIKKLAGTFSSSIVDGYLGVFNAQGHRLAEKLKTQVGKAPFDIHHNYIVYATLETICQIALGIAEISGNIVTKEYYEAFNRCLELMIERGMNVLYHPDCVYKLTASYKELKKCLKVIHQVSDTVLKNRKLERAKGFRNKAEEKDSSDPGVPKLRAVLDILLDHSEVDPTLTEEQIKNEVDTIILGGQETVAMTMFYVLLMLGCKTRVQEKVYAELKSVFGDSSRPVSKQDLHQMRYLEAVINETLRLFPPVPAVMRLADKDLQIRSFTIPKGTMCAISAWGAGRSTQVWGEDASLYRPERWLDDQPPNNAAGSLAFSYGRRACIGKKYAMAFLKTVLTHCLRELEFSSEADRLQFKVDISLRPISGHLIQVRERHV